MAIAYSLIAPKNDVIVIDRTRSADPVNYTFKLKIKNQGTTKVYYKLTETSGTWSIVSPTDGELGSVDSGSTSTKTITLQRALPTSDIVEPIDFILEAYSDSGYTNLIESIPFRLTAILADIHSWSSYKKYDFDDNTWQGWSHSETGEDYPTTFLSSEKSITPGGYSVKIYNNTNSIHAKTTSTLTKSETLPPNSRVVLVLYYNATLPWSGASLNYIQIKINGEVVFDTGSPIATSPQTTWDMVGVDLSDYAGQNVTIDIIVEGNVGYENAIFVDDIIIAGTDAL